MRGEPKGFTVYTTCEFVPLTLHVTGLHDNMFFKGPHIIIDQESQ